MATITPTIVVGNIPERYGDGTKRLFVTTESDVLFGFGELEPTTWHKYTRTNNSNLNIGTDFGKVWFWSPDHADNGIYITVGT